MGLEKEDIMALIAILQKGLTDDEDVVESKPQRKKTKPKKEPSTTNKFDSMAEKNMHKQDTAIDKKLWGNNQPTERTRKFQAVTVRCRVCGKTEQVSPSLIESQERYKCNRCAGASG